MQIGERAATRAIAQQAKAPKPANANRKLWGEPTWVTHTRDDKPVDDATGDTPRRERALPEWIAPAVGDGVPAVIIQAAAEATLAAAIDAGATRQQAAAAIAGMLARKFPVLQPLSIARVALETCFPEAPTRRNAPSRSAPLALMLRRDATWLRAAVAVTNPEPPILSPAAARVRDHLVTVGASFLPDLVGGMDLSPDAVEDALWELVGAGLATADGFASLRVLVDRKRGEVKSHFDRAAASAAAAAAAAVPPVRKWQEAIKKARNRDRERPAHALRALPTAAGRWSLLSEPKPEHVDVEASARQLLHRYGVVFRDLIARESSLPPWRDLLVALRRLEARGEIRGGRFVTGFVGEQFALPEALDELRGVRHPGPAAEIARVAATDPLNLVGVLSAGPRVPAIVGNAVLYVDGHPVASLEGGQLVLRGPIPPGAHIDDDLTYHPPPRPATPAPQAALPL
jgi:ATP-dependent Lhr-like helicase